MKLPEAEEWHLTFVQTGNNTYDLTGYSLLKMHNEQIAAQLTIAFMSGYFNRSDPAIIDAVHINYKDFLDKLNKGEI